MFYLTRYAEPTESVLLLQSYPAKEMNYYLKNSGKKCKIKAKLVNQVEWQSGNAEMRQKDEAKGEDGVDRIKSKHRLADM